MRRGAHWQKGRQRWARGSSRCWECYSPPGLCIRPTLGTEQVENNSRNRWRTTRYPQQSTVV
eukprot:3128857-Amphidinium_carterae.1